VTIHVADEGPAHGPPVMLVHDFPQNWWWEWHKLIEPLAVEVPVRFLHGSKGPVITTTLLRGYDRHRSDLQVETVDDVGHWIVDQRPDLVVQRLRAFLRV
jgi:pimeloyl-ACP methyl ester carboxylesterase